MRRFLIVLVLLILAAVPAFGRHAWGRYHWASKSYPMAIKVGDNTSSAWSGYVTEAIADWNKSSKLSLSKVAGSSNANCDPTPGRVEVCNGAYGQNGWLGIAQIWLTGSGRNHIGQATTKLNDTYYASARYNTPGWRDLVTCQEIGHDFGLAHQDERFSNANLGSCMDYTDYPDGGGTGGNLSNRAPNAHDYAQLDTIYNHTETSNSWFSTYDVMSQSIGRMEIPVLRDEVDEPWQWGTPVAWDDRGRPIRFERELRSFHNGDDHHDDGDETGDPVYHTVVTDVLWAPVDPFHGAGNAVEGGRPANGN
jgi:hypothetical protein